MRRRDSPIAAVIFDLDGVIRYWNPTIISTAESHAGLPAGVLADAVLGDFPLLERATTGRITDPEWRHTIAARLLLAYGDAGPRAVREWSTSPGEVVPAVLDLVRETRTWATVALLSNATSRLQDDLTRLDLLQEFDAVFNSSDLGLAKPDPAVFLEACKRLSVSPLECAFVDDSPANVQAAESAGLASHLYRGPSLLAAFVEKLKPPRR